MMECPQKKVTVSRQAMKYLQASIVGTLCNVLSRFVFAEFVGFDLSVVLSTYVGMIIVFLLSYHRAFGVSKATGRMIARFVLVSHAGLVTVWGVSIALFALSRRVFPVLVQPEALREALEPFVATASADMLVVLVPRLLEGGCHAAGILLGFAVNFLGHRLYSFAHGRV